MKKIICLIMLVVSIIFVPNVVYAQNNELQKNKELQQVVYEFPVAPRVLIYDYHEFVQEHEVVDEFIVVYYLPYRINKNFTADDYILIVNYAYGLARGVYNPGGSAYLLEEQFVEDDKTVFKFRITVLKSIINDRYGGDATPFFEVDSRMYIGIDEEDAYQRGFNAGVKSITDKYTSYVFKWTLPFVSLVIISGVYFRFKKEWFKK